MEKCWRKIFIFAAYVLVSLTLGCQGLSEYSAKTEATRARNSAQNILDRFAEGVKRETLFVTKRNKEGKSRVLLFCEMPTKDDVRVQSIDGYEQYPLQVFAYLVESENVYPPGLSKWCLMGRNRAKLMKQFKAHKKFVDIVHLHRDS